MNIRRIISSENERTKTVKRNIFASFAIKGVRMSEKGIFYGIIVSLAVGLPLFAYGNLNGDIPLILAGSLATIGASGIMAVSFGNKK